MLRAETIDLPHGDPWDVLTGGEGPLLVWLHGLRRVEPDDPVLCELARYFRVVAPLAPGFVHPADLDRLDDIHDVALAYDDLFVALGAPVRLLVGHSLGAMYAAEAAAHVPIRHERLALLAPFGLWADDAPVTDIFAVPAAELDSLIWADEEARAASAPPAAGDFGEGLVEAARDLRAAAKFLWPIPDKGLRKRLRRITIPTLAIFGERDAVIPSSYAQAFAHALPSSRTEVLPGAGHMMPLEQPAAIVQRLLRHAGLD
jgi:pimeloyl-ACP methyl ester carboxylesterase